MTPQLRQAIQLLQFSNLEVSAFIDEELERNPLLERGEAVDTVAPERAAPDQIPVAVSGDPIDLSDTTRGDVLPSAGADPFDAEHAETYDPGTTADGAPYRNADDDGWSIEDVTEGARTLRDQLSEQLRLSISDPAERLIGAHLIALLDPSGRLAAEPDSIATALGADLAQVEAVRARMMRFEPVGMFARDLRECLAVQLIERNRYDPAIAALLDNCGG
jgi:RNA polymerase sigma-54 factor